MSFQNQLAFAAAPAAHPLSRTAFLQRALTRPAVARSRPTLVAAPRMGLNAASLKKAQQGGKGGKKGGAAPPLRKDAAGAAGAPDSGAASATAAKTGAVPQNSKMDTSRREFIFQMYKVGKRLPNGKDILKDITLAFLPGAKIGVLGPNGAGKSTLIKIMAGVDTEFLGDAQPQEPKLDKGATVIENVEYAIANVRDSLNRFNELGNLLADPNISDTERSKINGEMERIQNFIEANNGWEIDRLLERALEALRCPPSEALVANLSGGEKRRVALCQQLLRKPDLLILDEPTNHLDAESVAWLERFLKEFPGTVVAVTHDRYFLDDVAEWILELDRGAGIPYKGNYSTYLENKAARLAQEAKEKSARQKELDKELEWVRTNPKGRQSKQKARVARYEDLLREDEEARKRGNSTLTDIYIPPGPLLGNVVVEANNLRKTYGDKLLMDDVSFSLPRGGIVGVIGGNGAGKTTLFKMIMGFEQPDGGSLRIGETVVPMYVDQNRDMLSTDKTVFMEIADGNDIITLGKRDVASRQYLSWFNFKGSDQQKMVKDLSGGERNRLNLAKILKQPGNLLLLDEPTNDLDVETLRALEEAILGFAGCAVIISHDRWFLDRVATHILAFEGESKVTWFEGSYSDYEADRKRRLGNVEPTRVKYRPLPAM